MKFFKKPLASYLYQAGLFSVLISCLTPLDFPVEIAGGRLVVSGQISTLSDQNIIQLGITANINRLPFPIGGASITLFDDTGDSFSYAESLSPGIYTLNNVPGIPGRTYQIEIALPNGKIYKSLPEKMPEPAVLNSTYYEIVKEEVVDSEGAFTSKDFLKVYGNSTFTSSNSAFLKWSVEEAFLLSPTDFPDPFGSIPPPCFVIQNADPQRVVLFDRSATSSSFINGLLVGSRIIDWTFLEKHYFTTYQSSITKESFEYWRKVNILANQVGSIFDTPPAEITGNIININNPSEKTLGFFQVSNQSYQRFVLRPSNLPFPILNGKCDFDGNFNTDHYSARCIDCTSARNSSYVRPIWF